MLLLGCSWAQKLIISVYNAIVWNILNLLQCDLLNKNVIIIQLIPPLP